MALIKTKTEMWNILTTTVIPLQFFHIFQFLGPIWRHIFRVATQVVLLVTCLLQLGPY